jgi:hypothetical protein
MSERPELTPKAFGAKEGQNNKMKTQAHSQQNAFLNTINF